MPSSDFVFEEGAAIDVGSHGTHDFVFADGSEVLDNGESSVVFEAGTGLGGGNWVAFAESNYNGDVTVNNGGTPLLNVEHDGSNTGSDGRHAGAYRDQPIQAPFDVTFKGVSTGRGSIQNNKSVGFYDTVGPFEANESGTQITILVEEGTSPSPGEFYLYTNSNRSSTFTVPNGADVRFTYDGSTVEVFVDGVSKASAPKSDSGDWFPNAALEDDPDVTEADSLTIDDFLIN